MILKWVNVKKKLKWEKNESDKKITSDESQSS